MSHEKNKNGSPNASPRFFYQPNLDALADHPVIGPRINPNGRPKKKKRKKEIKMRYAAYVRISSEEQVGNYSIDAQ